MKTYKDFINENFMSEDELMEMLDNCDTEEQLNEFIGLAARMAAGAVTAAAAGKLGSMAADKLAAKKKEQENKLADLDKEMGKSTNKGVNEVTQVTGGSKVPGGLTEEEDEEEDMDAGNAAKAVKETPKSERDDKDAKQKPAKFDAARAAVRKRIEAHQERQKNKDDADLGW